MNEKKILESKQDLMKELGKEYPTYRKELTPGFLLNFAEYLPCPDENEFEDYREYDKAKYASEKCAFISKMTSAVAALIKDSESGKAIWEEYLDWVTENYFPEFTK